MAKDDSVGELSQPQKPVPDAVAPPVVSLHEFCIRASQNRTSPELLSAFEYVERSAGRLQDVDAAYSARYDAFAGQPV